MTTTAMVTGVAGFIGSRLAAALLASGVERVVGIDRLSDYYDVRVKRANLERIDSRAFEFVEGDLLDRDVTSLLDGVDVVFHEAAQPGVQTAWGSAFDTYVDDNIRATRHLLEAIARSGNRAKLVNASSSSVYGEMGQMPVSEEHATRPLSPYGVTKLAAEQLVSVYARECGVDAVSLRYFTVYGPGQRPDMAFARMCSRIQHGQPIEIYGSGEQMRDFTYIDDVVRATLLAWQRPTPTAAVINIAGGAARSLNDCVGILAGLSGRPAERITYPAARGDARRTSADTALAARLLGWFPEISIETGLKYQFESMTNGG